MCKHLESKTDKKFLTVEPAPSLFYRDLAFCVEDFHLIIGRVHDLPLVMEEAR